jgi:hypothetical protein
MFIECLAEDVQDEQKHQWLLLQLAPVELLELRRDIFEDLAGKVSICGGLLTTLQDS